MKKARWHARLFTLIFKGFQGVSRLIRFRHSAGGARQRLRKQMRSPRQPNSIWCDML